MLSLGLRLPGKRSVRWLVCCSEVGSLERSSSLYIQLKRCTLSILFKERSLFCNSPSGAVGAVCGQFEVSRFITVTIGYLISSKHLVLSVRSV